MNVIIKFFVFLSIFTHDFQSLELRLKQKIWLADFLAESQFCFFAAIRESELELGPGVQLGPCLRRESNLFFDIN